MSDTNDTRSADPAQDPQDDDRHELLRDFARRVDAGDGVVDSLRGATGTTWEAQNVSGTEDTTNRAIHPEPLSDETVEVVHDDDLEFQLRRSIELADERRVERQGGDR